MRMSLSLHLVGLLLLLHVVAFRPPLLGETALTACSVVRSDK